MARPTSVQLVTWKTIASSLPEALCVPLLAIMTPSHCKKEESRQEHFEMEIHKHAICSTYNVRHTDFTRTAQ
ncbi:hypothetical protein BX666DRAFT_1985087 [Dichotomocladium elegans]|nr:hypothetical protein BX666DRAFT_1985087 [Dichotomocladium elegans]